MRLKNRRLDPAFFQSEDLTTVSMAARLLFAGLWLIADREGRLPDKPIVIKGLLFPYEDKFKVVTCLEELEGIYSIVRYEEDGIKVIWIPRFTDFQNVHPHEKQSELPEPPDELLQQLKSKKHPKPKSAKKPKDDILDDTSIPYEQVVTDLNLVLNLKLPKGYKHTSRKNRELIKARFADGYTLKDFMQVHRIKYADWKDDNKYSTYLRPETLWSNKFEGYLNQVTKNGDDKHGSGVKAKTRRDVSKAKIEGAGDK